MWKLSSGKRIEALTLNGRADDFLYRPIVAKIGGVARFVMLREFSGFSATIDCFEQLSRGQALSLELNEEQRVDGHITRIQNLTAEVVFSTKGVTFECLPRSALNPKIEIDCSASILRNGKSIKVRVASVAQRELKLIGGANFAQSHITVELPDLPPLKGRIVRSLSDVSWVRLSRPLPYSIVSNWAVDRQRELLSSEHRGSLRVRCDRYLVAKAASGSAHIQLKDISRDGLRFSASGNQFELGNILSVEADGISLPQGQIVWKNGSFYGVEFSNSLSQSTFEYLAKPNYQS